MALQSILLCAFMAATAAAGPQPLSLALHRMNTSMVGKRLPKPLRPQRGFPNELSTNGPGHSLSGSSNQTAPLFGGIYLEGLFFVQLFLGGQPARLQLDTGSSTLAVFASEFSLQLDILFFLSFYIYIYI